MGRNIMETNESVLAREAVVIDTQSRAGKITGLRVDTETRLVSHYILGSTLFGAEVALPFAKPLALGDTFLMVQSTGDFLQPGSAEANQVISEGFALVGSEVFSKTGNKLGVVASFEFDPLFGAVSKIVLEDGRQYPAATFIFFSKEFTFIDDGGLTAQQMRGGDGADADDVLDELFATAEAKAAKPAADTAAAAAASAMPPYRDEAAAVEAAEPTADTVATTADTSTAAAAASAMPPYRDESAVAVAAPPVPTAAPTDDLDEMLVMFETEAVKPAGQASAGDGQSLDNAIGESLVGLVIDADIQSDDGLFSVTKGTTLTKELVAAAAEHGALLQLAMNLAI